MGTIGEKRNWIRIDQQVSIPDGQGGHTLSWTPLLDRAGFPAILAAHERPATGTETDRAAQLTSVRQVVFEIWWRDDVSVKDRVHADKGRLLEIASYQDPDDERDELYLYCAEVQR